MYFFSPVTTLRDHPNLRDIYSSFPRTLGKGLTINNIVLI